MNESTKVNPEEYGLKQENATQIEQAFQPQIQERENLVSVYKQVVSSEISEQTCKDAKSLRLKLVKVRTGIAGIHKTQKLSG